MNKLHGLIIATLAVCAAAWFASHRAEQQFGLEQGQLLLRSHHGGIVEVDEGMLSPQLKACWLWQLPIESSPCHFFQLNPALSRAV